MKKKEKLLNKKSMKVFVYTLLVLGIIEFTIYPDTNSKYLDQPENAAFSYQANLYGLYKGVIEKVPGDSKKLEKIVLNRDSSTYNSMALNLFFTRNENIMNDTTLYKDTFSLELPTNCSINYGHGYDKNGKKITDNTIINVDKTHKTIRVNDNKEDTVNQVFVSLTCDLKKWLEDKLEDYIISFPIKEYVNNEEEDFTIWDVKYSIKSKDYHDIKPIPSITTGERYIEIPKNYEGNKLAAFQDFIKKYVTKYEETYKESVKKDIEHILKYVNDAYLEFIKNDGNGVAKKEINGMIAECNKEQCTYTIQDNFIGYAKTKVSGYHGNFIYFSDLNSTTTDFNKIFNDYLRNHVYPDKNVTVDGVITNPEADKVYKYVMDLLDNDIKNAFDVNYAIKGVYIDSLEKKLTITNDILEIIDYLKKSTIDVKHDSNTKSMKDELFQWIQTKYPQEKLNLDYYDYFFDEDVFKNEDFVKLFYNANKENIPETTVKISYKYTPAVRDFEFIIKADSEYSYLTLVVKDENGNVIKPITDEVETPVLPSDTDIGSGNGNTPADDEASTIIEDLEVPEKDLEGVNDLVIAEDQDKLNVKIEASSSENIVSIVESLDEHFNAMEPTTIPANAFIPKEDGSYEAIYTIKTK